MRGQTRSKQSVKAGSGRTSWTNEGTHVECAVLRDQARSTKLWTKEINGRICTRACRRARGVGKGRGKASGQQKRCHLHSGPQGLCSPADAQPPHFLKQGEREWQDEAWVREREDIAEKDRLSRDEEWFPRFSNRETLGTRDFLYS